MTSPSHVATISSASNASAGSASIVNEATSWASRPPGRGTGGDDVGRASAAGVGGPARAGAGDVGQHGVEGEVEPAHGVGRAAGVIGVQLLGQAAPGAPAARPR